MASENNLKTAEYELFNEENHFNIASIKETVQEVMKSQERYSITHQMILAKILLDIQ